MRLGRWVLGLAALAFLFSATADAQIEANQLCLHNGGEYYVNGGFHYYPNHGGGKFFPKFTHCPGTQLNGAYPWKIAGWAWTGMQAAIFGPTWYWETALQAILDNANASTMSWDYPSLYCLGIVPHTGPPMPIYGGTIGTAVPIVGGEGMIFPSTMGGFDAYLNIFAVGAASFFIPSTAPYYGWLFGFSADCASAITLPSSYSIYEFAWQQKGPNHQYLILSGNEVDCFGNSGNQGRNYSLISDFDNGYLWYWNNSCAGIAQEWAMCLFLCDAVTIPYNVPGAPNAANPYAPYGFDVGAVCVTPYLSSGCVSLGFRTCDYTGNAGDVWIVLGGLFPGATVWGANAYRLCFGWGPLTNFFAKNAALFVHIPTNPGQYPECMWGSSTGAHSLAFPFPPDPGLLCATINWAGLNTSAGLKPSATFSATYF